MGLRFSVRVGRRVRVALALLSLLAAAAAALLAPPLALPAIMLAAAALVWDQAALAGDLRALAAAVAAGEADAHRPHDEVKLEVADGAWGELCHALNRLLQQRRAERQVGRLLPALPLVAVRLAEQRPPAEGLPCEVAVLSVAIPPAAGDQVAAMRDAAYLALHQAELHDALLARWGEGAVLIFGALAHGGPAALRRAHQAARAISAGWAGATPAQRPRLALAGGRGRLVVLPGLGLTVVGPPVEHAVTLQGLAAGAPLVCNEEAYLGLRRLGLIPPVEPAGAPRAAPPQATRLPSAEGRPPAFAVPL